MKIENAPPSGLLRNIKPSVPQDSDWDQIPLIPRAGSFSDVEPRVAPPPIVCLVSHIAASCF